MQQLTAAPRDTLTAAQVTALLLGEPLRVTPGVELLDGSLAVVADISVDLAGGSIERSCNATIHGTAKLQLSRSLAWGVDLVRPYMVLDNGTVTARWNLGVYALTTPEHVVGASPETYAVQGYDRLYLLNRAVGDSYAVASGTGYLAAVRAAITAAGLTGVSLDGTSEAKTLPTDMTWPLAGGQAGSGTTWLNVINDLLAAVGYRGLWADENGLFRSEPYVDPTSRASEFTFAASGATSLVGVERTEVADVWATPNQWVFVQQNSAATPVAGAGIYTVTNTATGPTSVTARGLTWPKVVLVDAADQAALQSRGDIIVAEDTRSHATLKVTTAPFPPAGHFDVFTYQDPAYRSSDVMVMATHWLLDLMGGDMAWDWDVVA